MPLTGQAKADASFVDYRYKKQMIDWPKIVNGDLSQAKPDLDSEIRQAAENENTPFRSEGLTLKELWMLYIGTDKLSEEDEARGKKKTKETIVQPIKARRVVGYEILDKDGNPSGSFSYDKIQYLDKRGRPTGKFNLYEPVRFHDDGYLYFDQWLYARDQARKDLFWLNVAVLGNTKLTKATHQIVCDQFIQKNFDGVYKQGYSVDTVQSAILRQDRVPVEWNPTVKNYTPRPGAQDDQDNYQRFMILLYPRAFFKSTIGRADAVQWLLCCPDISMMIMTAARDLAATFVLEIKKQFYLARGAEPKALHLLFPEYVLRGVDGTSAEDLVTPARRRERTYPTLWADSIDSTLSGWHCDMLKFDDVVSNSNCNTEATRKKLKDQIDNTLNLCDTWGKVDMLGTRYFPDDYYGTRLEKSIEDSETAGMKYFVGQAWYVKPEFMSIAKKNLRDLTESMVTLTFPEHATFKYLRGLLVNNEQTFRCQQLNEPVWGDNFSIHFSEVDLKAAIVSPLEAQRWRGEIYILWDTAKEAKKGSDYSVGVAMKIFQKEDGQVAVVVMEVIFGKWTQTEIAYNMAGFNKKWMPKLNQVEDTGGLELLKIEVRNRSMQMFGFPPNMYWRRPDNEDNAKRNRIKSLEILVKTQRLYFANGPWLEERDGVFPQLMGYTGEKSSRTRKDDIPDAMSSISRYLPSSAPLSPKEQEEKAIREEQQYESWAMMEQYRRVFGNLPGVIPVPENVEEYSCPTSPVGDIAANLFGGNGMRA